jgi:hypothetical protein
MNLNNSVTHCIAANSKGSLSLSVIHNTLFEKGIFSWLHDRTYHCISNKDCRLQGLNLKQPNVVVMSFIILGYWIAMHKRSSSPYNQSEFPTEYGLI